MAISRNQPMRPALNDTMDAVDSLVAGTVPDGSVNRDKLSSDVQSALSFVATIPDIEFGTSNSINVPATSQASVDITFASGKTEAPVVFLNLQHAGAYGDLTWYVQSVSNQQAAIMVVNNGSEDANDITVDWLAISGR